MIRNIIFIVLFVVLYGGLYLFASNNGGNLTDRNGYGEMTDTYYDCERFSVKMEFEPDWIVFDGVSMDESIANSSAQAEIEQLYGVLGDYTFIGGFATPEAEIYSLALIDYNLTAQELSETAIRTELDYMKKTIEGQGGKIGLTGCRTLSAKGNGNPMLMYYYDYTLGEDYYTSFTCYVNSGDDAILFQGTYDNLEGYKRLTDFVENKLTIYSDSSIIV